MNGYTDAPANCSYEGTPQPKAPTTLKDAIADTNSTIGRVNHLLDCLWAWFAEPGMDMDTPPKPQGECLLAAVVYAQESVHEMEAKIERIMKMLGV